MNEDNQGVAGWRDASALFPFNKTTRELASSSVADYEHSRGHFGAAELGSGRVFPGRSRCR